MSGSGKWLFSRKAGVTIEVVLAVLLATTVLLLVIGLFNNNLLTMADSGGINNLFNQNNTANDSFSKDYSNSQVTVHQATQQNIPTIGEQGLEYILGQIETELAKLLAKPQPLSDQNDIKNLAKLLTQSLAGQDKFSPTADSLKTQNGITKFTRTNTAIYIEAGNKSYNIENLPNQIRYRNTTDSQAVKDQKSDMAIANIKAIESYFSSH